MNFLYMAKKISGPRKGEGYPFGSWKNCPYQFLDSLWTASHIKAKFYLWEWYDASQYGLIVNNPGLAHLWYFKPCHQEACKESSQAQAALAAWRRAIFCKLRLIRQINLLRREACLKQLWVHTTWRASHRVLMKPHFDRKRVNLLLTCPAW